MADMQSRLAQVYSLEQLSRKNTVIHRLHPLSKMAVTLVYIICVACHGRYDLLSLAPFLFYPMVVMALAEVPFSMIGKRVLIALPFCLFAGISNLVLDRKPLLTVGSLVVTAGAVSFLAILLRTGLCVAAVLILVAVTPLSEMTHQLRRLHIPAVFVSLIEMIYRYIGVLLEEADIMLTAYRLRNPAVKWPLLTDIGSFIGQLFLKSYDRAERVYQAMQCRGYGMGDIRTNQRALAAGDWVFLLAGCLTSILFLVMGGSYVKA